MTSIRLIRISELNRTQSPYKDLISSITLSYSKIYHSKLNLILKFYNFKIFFKRIIAAVYNISS